MLHMAHVTLDVNKSRIFLVFGTKLKSNGKPVNYMTMNVLNKCTCK